MILDRIFEIIVVAVALLNHPPCGECLTDQLKVTGEDAVRRFLVWYDKEKSGVVNQLAQTQWNYHTNMTPYNEEIMKQGRHRLYNFMKLTFQNASRFDWKNLKNDTLRRQMQEIHQLDNAVLSEKKLDLLLAKEAHLLETYSSAKICGQHKLESHNCYDQIGVADIFASSTDESKLRLVWQRWHENLGHLIKPDFKTYVDLSNEKAIHNNFSDMGAYWRAPYEWPCLEEDVRMLWEQVKPLYMQLHAYVRKKLVDMYGTEVLSPIGLIPAHLLGDVLAYSWGGINVPFQNIYTPNITGKMNALNYTVKRIVEIAEDFFVSLGFPRMPPSFWNRSLFEAPKDGRNVMCHATAWNFYDKEDYRLLICGEVIAEHLYIIHHEMGHLHYFMAYKDQPYSFQNGANPAFHEAIGDAILLSVMTPHHLQSIGLLNKMEENHLFHSYDGEINFLFMQALPTISTLPMSYLIDLWRWDIFRGRSNEHSWNEEWWRLRAEIQGLAPPLPRSEWDFDAATIFHVATFSPFIRYFLGELLKYQFHRALCLAAGQYNPKDPARPLFKCNIYNSKEAGHLLSEMLKLGYSKHWSYALKTITHGKENKIDASALLEYFKPLMNYLKTENELTSERIGWGEQPPIEISGAHKDHALRFMYVCHVLVLVKTIFTQI